METNKGSNSYQDRQKVANTAEFLFEYYCAEKEYSLNRLGFDEKNKNIDNFFKLNPLIRNLPDYVVNTDTNTYVVNVKGTANFKKKEIDMIPQFLEIFSSAKAPLIYAFCFVGKNPILLKPEKILELWEQSEDRQWPDGVVYRNLNIG